MRLLSNNRFVARTALHLTYLHLTPTPRDPLIDEMEEALKEPIDAGATNAMYCSALKYTHQVAHNDIKPSKDAVKIHWPPKSPAYKAQLAMIVELLRIGIDPRDLSTGSLIPADLSNIRTIAKANYDVTSTADEPDATGKLDMSVHLQQKSVHMAMYTHSLYANDHRDKRHGPERTAEEVMAKCDDSLLFMDTWCLKMKVNVKNPNTGQKVRITPEKVIRAQLAKGAGKGAGMEVDAADAWILGHHKRQRAYEQAIAQTVQANIAVIPWGNSAHLVANRVHSPRSDCPGLPTEEEPDGGYKVEYHTKHALHMEAIYNAMHLSAEPDPTRRMALSTNEARYMETDIVLSYLVSRIFPEWFPT